MRSAPDMLEVGWPDPAEVLQRIESTRSCWASSWMSARLCTVMAILRARLRSVPTVPRDKSPADRGSPRVPGGAPREPGGPALESLGVARPLDAAGLLLDAGHHPGVRHRGGEAEPGPVGGRAGDRQPERADVLDLTSRGQPERLVVTWVDDVSHRDHAVDAGPGLVGAPEDERALPAQRHGRAVHGVTGDQRQALLILNGDADAGGRVAGEVEHAGAQDELVPLGDLADLHPFQDRAGPGGGR